MAISEECWTKSKGLLADILYFTRMAAQAEYADRKASQHLAEAVANSLSVELRERRQYPESFPLYSEFDLKTVTTSLENILHNFDQTKDAQSMQFSLVSLTTKLARDMLGDVVDCECSRKSAGQVEEPPE